MGPFLFKLKRLVTLSLGEDVEELELFYSLLVEMKYGIDSYNLKLILNSMVSSTL